jgi:hypothetical protein
VVSLGSRIAATILVVVFWFAFIVLYLAFFAGGLDWWQPSGLNGLFTSSEAAYNCIMFLPDHSPDTTTELHQLDLILL